jgi:hypothetical protein
LTKGSLFDENIIGTIIPIYIRRGPYLSEWQWGTVREDYSRKRRRLELILRFITMIEKQE